MFKIGSIVYAAMVAAILIFTACLTCGCSSTSVTINKPDGTTILIERVAFCQELDGAYEDETRDISIRLKSNPSAEAFKAGVEAARILRP